MKVPHVARVVVFALLPAILIGCTKAEDPWKDAKPGTPRVVVSFPPLYCFTTKVGGDDVAVRSLLTSQGPHGYVPVPHDAVILRKANLFLLNGLDLDEFQKLANSAANKNLKVVQVGEAVPVKERIPMSHDHQHGPGEADHHHHGEHDPHVWLGVPQAIAMVQKISAALQETNPSKAAEYQKREAAYIEELRGLEKYGRDKLAGSKNRKLITQHESLGYFARTFDLDIAGSIQLRPGVEPDPVQQAKLVDLCKKGNVRVLAVEPQYSHKAANALKDQLAKQKIDLHIVEIDPFETAAADKLEPDLYVRTMRQNIDRLAEKLQ